MLRHILLAAMLFITGCAKQAPPIPEPPFARDGESFRERIVSLANADLIEEEVIAELGAPDFRTSGADYGAPLMVYWSQELALADNQYTGYKKSDHYYALFFVDEFLDRISVVRYEYSKDGEDSKMPALDRAGGEKTLGYKPKDNVGWVRAKTEVLSVPELPEEPLTED